MPDQTDEVARFTVTAGADVVWYQNTEIGAASGSATGDRVVAVSGSTDLSIDRVWWVTRSDGTYDLRLNRAPLGAAYGNNADFNVYFGGDGVLKAVYVCVGGSDFIEIPVHQRRSIGPHYLNLTPTDAQATYLDAVSAGDEVEIVIGDATPVIENQAFSDTLALAAARAAISTAQLVMPDQTYTLDPGSSVSAIFTPTGGQGPYTFEIQSGGPSWVTEHTSQTAGSYHLIVFPPTGTAAGEYTTLVRVTDSLGFTTLATLTTTVEAVPVQAFSDALQVAAGRGVATILTLALPGTAGLSVSRSNDDVTATVSAPSSGGAPSLYRVQRSTSSTFSSISSTRTRTTPGSVSFSNLSSGTHYFRARAENSTGNGAWSATRSTTVPTQLALPGTAGLSISRSDDDVTATVTAPSSGGAVATYRVQRSTSSAFTSPSESTRTSPGSVSFNNLSSGTHYFRARAENSTGNGAWSATRSTTVPTPTPPTPTGNSFSLTIGTPGTDTTSAFSWNFGSANPLYLPSGLVDLGQGSTIRLSSFSIFPNQTFSITVTFDGDDNDELVSSWENRSLALRVQAGDARLDLPGPNHSSNINSDPNEPYFYTPSDPTAQDQRDFIADHRDFHTSVRNATSLTFYY